MPGLAPPHPETREQLLAYLAQQRYVLRLAAYGLTDDEARSAPSVSSLSISGLVKHVASVEEFWTSVMTGAYEPGAHDEGYTDGFVAGPGQDIEHLLARYAELAARTDRAARSLPAGHQVRVPPEVPWFPKDVEAWTVEWVLLHLIEETARHAGHADIVRESLDGAQAFPLMAAAEHWPPSPWLQPWQRPGAQGPVRAPGA